MRNEFIISNIFSQSWNRFTKINADYLEPNILCNGDFGCYNGLKIIVDGFVIPRNSVFMDYKTDNQYELIGKLYIKYGNKIGLYIKGFFCIVIISQNEISIINDIHSVKRCFICKKGTDYIISNSLADLKPIVGFEIDFNAAATHALMQHFVLGKTMFEGVSYSMPASFIHIQHNAIFINQYLGPFYFAELKRSKISHTDFYDVFKETITNYCNYFQPHSISATLTGGRDTRTILSALISLGIKPNCFTFGMPTGIDVITAKEVARKCRLNFSNHYIDPLTPEAYSTLVDEIIKINNPFIHIHRAHRLDAIKKEKQLLGGSLDMVFVGAMGGDYIMGEGFNDYIITEFIRRFLTETTPKVQIISDVLSKHYAYFDDYTIDSILSLLSLFGLEHNLFDKQTEFNLVHNLIGSTHDIQDINLFMEHANYVIAPFMDIDVMEALFSSNLSLFSNNRHTKNPFRRLRGGELQCGMIKHFTPDLADINFANQYSANDVLGNRFRYVIKRIYLHSLKIKSKPTFVYSDWFLPFVKKEMDEIDPVFNEFYDIQLMRSNFLSANHQTHEGYWHKYTNPITLNRYYKHNHNQ